MGDRKSVSASPYATARTGPARELPREPVAAHGSPGLVLLYSPSFRSLAPAYPFGRGEIVVGRDPTCAVVLDDHAVSRHHARIVNERGVYRVVDLDSRNGTFVDGERVHEATLEPMHELRVGDALFKFVGQEAEQYAPYRIDGAVNGVMPGPPSAHGAVGGFVLSRARAELARIATADLSCVLLGETGTGKEVFAREVHRLSGRRGAFVPVHCAAIPQNLFESELFGFRRGAFSGADRDKPGLIQLAHEGTLFLDEIGDMPLDLQVKLLRVLQFHEVVPLGAARPEPVDLRVVCATHRDLYRLVQEGSFRGDLFARIGEHVMVIPPLRERKEDVFALTQAFIALSGRRVEPSFGFVMALLGHDWPFNVRELQSAIKRAVALAEGGILEPRHLPPTVLDGSPEHASGSAGAGRPDVRLRPSDPRPPAQLSGEGFLRGVPTEATMRELLARHAGNVAAVGRELGKGRMQVHRWVKRYGLSLDDYRGR
jgi:transcriptional regulator of acetoin/glycerol metabolism